MGGDCCVFDCAVWGNWLAAMITQERLKELLDYDQETGVFVRRIVPRSSRVQIGAIAGTLKKRGYLVIGIDNSIYMAHRLAWLYVYGKFPDNGIDHINGVRNDNRIVNLRDVTQKINIQNQRLARSDNKLGMLGVSTRRGKFMAQININGIRTYLGDFEIAEDAHEAYLAAKRKFHLGCTI